MGGSEAGSGKIPENLSWAPGHRDCRVCYDDRIMTPSRIVLVEDHTMVRQLFAHLVQKDLGLTLAADCTTVAEGTAALLREKPDLAIVDWMLPDGRGFDLVRAAGPKLPRTRWLFVSSNEQGHLVREAVSLGVHGFVMKRSDLPTLRLAITRVLAGEKYYCPSSSRLLVEKLVDESRIIAANLTSRERQVLRGYAHGENPKALSDRLGVSAKTVQNHLTLLKDKLGVREPAELVHYAIKHGYIEAP
jgi:DNA-binding NarL/FixJ family response regulator